MEVKTTDFPGLLEIIHPVYTDERGAFAEIYHQDKFREKNIPYKFLQDNVSWSVKGVIRGLHLQEAPHGQAKLVRVLKGEVLDIAVDLRPDSPTFGKAFSKILNASDNNALMIPEGFAHGFAVLEDAVFHYKCSGLYHKESESGIIWNDPDLNIDWMLNDFIVSAKDKNLPTFRQYIEQINKS